MLTRTILSQPRGISFRGRVSVVRQQLPQALAFGRRLARRHGTAWGQPKIPRRQSRRSEVTFALCNCRLKEWTNHRDTVKEFMWPKKMNHLTSYCAYSSYYIAHSEGEQIDGKRTRLVTWRNKNGRWARIILTLWPYLVYSILGQTSVYGPQIAGLDQTIQPHEEAYEQRRWAAWSKCSQSESTILGAWSFRGIPK